VERTLLDARHPRTDVIALHRCSGYGFSLSLISNAFHMSLRTRARANHSFVPPLRAELKCFGCGWSLPGGEIGKTEGAWERHRAAVGRACKYAAARPASQPLAQYAKQRDTVALQQLLLVTSPARRLEQLTAVSLCSPSRVDVVWHCRHWASSCRLPKRHRI
jgi:hypothetical protein